MSFYKVVLSCLGLLAGCSYATGCVSYGIDFQNGGSYFQNVSSTDDFTFVSLFEGCENDVANNVLVDPNGDQYQCTNTTLTPSDVNEISTCPLMKDQLYTGDWSVLILSNNGDADPIAYERDFYLSVGIPATVTYTPTLTLYTTTTPIFNVTTTTTVSLTNTSTAVVTVPSSTQSPTVTVLPRRVTSTYTKTIATITKTARVVSPLVITATHTATCSVPGKQQYPDPTCSIRPTIVTAAAFESNLAKEKFRRVADAPSPRSLSEILAERKARLAKKKRSPDSATLTITDTNSMDWGTITSTSTAATYTISITEATTAYGVTTTTSTIMSGISTVPVVTVTAPTPTITRTIYTVYTTTAATLTRTQVVTVTKTWEDPVQASVCNVKGGQMV